MSKRAVTGMRSHDARVISEVLELRRLAAKDAMIKPVFLRPEDDPKTIIKKLKKEDTNVCIVVTEDKKFVGEISDEDLIRVFLLQSVEEPLTKYLDIGYMKGFGFKRAKDLVNKHKSTVKGDTHIAEVIKLVYKEGFQYIPVLDEEGRVKGVVTPSSLLDLLQYY